MLLICGSFNISPCPGLPQCQPAEGSARRDRADLSPAQHVVHGRQCLRPRPLCPPHALRVLWRGASQQGLRASSKTVVDHVAVVSLFIHNIRLVYCTSSIFTQLYYNYFITTKISINPV